MFITIREFIDVHQHVIICYNSDNGVIALETSTGVFQVLSYPVNPKLEDALWLERIWDQPTGTAIGHVGMAEQCCSFELINFTPGTTDPRAAAWVSWVNMLVLNTEYALPSAHVIATLDIDISPDVSPEDVKYQEEQEYQQQQWERDEAHDHTEEWEQEGSDNWRYGNPYGADHC